MIITKNCIVEATLQMNFVGDAEIIEMYNEEEPAEFAIGMDEILPAMEALLLGKKAGDKLDFVIKKEDGFGEYNEEDVFELPLETFFNEQGVIDEEEIFEGAIVSLTTDEGEPQDAMILEITDQDVLVDLNHPFAGEDLHYEMMILSVRLAD
jgi:FKBP-type peptidyl-prolyl cis-trans isomerase SlyD